MTEARERPSIRAIRAVMVDEIGLFEKRGPAAYKEFKEEAIKDIDRMTGLGRWVQDGMDQAATPEDADRVFRIAYILFNTRNAIESPIPDEEV